MTARAQASLVRWLGPWAERAVPTGVRRSELWLGPDRDVYAYAYEPERHAPIGAYLVAQGLHHMGPDDPRMDRFCRALAAAGMLVLAPGLRDFLALRIAPRATDDLALGWEQLASMAAARRLPRPAVFSISFGGSPAIELCARLGDRVGALVLFGAFADFDATVRHAVAGEGRDPLNSPAVFLNLLDVLESDAGRRGPLALAWRTMVERTWGRMELKRPGARDPIAHEIAEALPPAQRELFLVGCGLAPGGLAILERALAATRDDFAFADPRPHLPELRAPVLLVHGRDDDVIPWTEVHKLSAALRPGHEHRVFITGLYGHTGAALPPLGALAREGITLLGLVRALVDAPTRRR